MSEESETAKKNQPEQPTIVVRAQQIFQGRNEVFIQHEGVRYRMRITRKGKLLLQK